MRLVGGPEAGGDEFRQVMVGVPEVETHTALRPLNRALNFHVVLSEVGAPVLQLFFVDGKGKMGLAAVAVRRNESTLNLERGLGRFFGKQQQDVAPCDIERDKALTFKDGIEAEQLL